MRIGLHALAHARFTRENLKNIVYPVNYWRTIEYRVVFDALTPSASDRILDIGSPKLLALYIAEKYRSQVCSVDISGNFLGDYQNYRSLRRLDTYTPAVMDGRNLEFPDNHFTKIFSISVIEHIPGDGDSECLREIGRVLAPGGICAITIPFAPESRDEYLDAEKFYWSASYGSDKKLFFQRRYSENDIFQKLIRPSGLSVKSLLYMGEKPLTGSAHELDNYMNVFTAPLQPLLSKLLHTGPAASWKNLSKPLAAFLLLQKL